ncbi:MAG TPA: FprA family A-type flavoprotein [Chloroflexi bacterium]|nr:FprA family A-type flavoprotein [Chloroflexota bacterium]
MSSRMLVVYESHTGNTRRMAQAVAEGARQVQGVEVVLKSLHDLSAEELAEVDAVVVGAPTRNAKVPPATAQFLKRLGQAPLKGKLGASFGSYGWSGEAPALIRSSLVEQGLVAPWMGVRGKRAPDSATVGNCRSLGASVAQRLIEGGG